MSTIEREMFSTKVNAKRLPSQLPSWENCEQNFLIKSNLFAAGIAREFPEALGSEEQPPLNKDYLRPVRSILEQLGWVNFGLSDTKKCFLPSKGSVVWSLVLHKEGQFSVWCNEYNYC